VNRTYVSIDWGGTHLSGVILNSDKTTKEFELPSCNLKIVSDENLFQICKNIIKEIKPETNSKITMLIGAAGVSNDKTAQRVIKTFNELTNSIDNIEVYPDFLCNHAAFLNGEDGILSINGTGSILFGVNGKKQIRLGGWGYLFDITPSGAYFGKEYIEAVLKGKEGSKTHLYYSEDFKTKYGQVEREELLNQIYSAPSIQNYLGQYSKDLISAYETDEPSAKEIVNKSIEKLSKSISEITSYLELKNPKFCGSGGLWDNWKNLKNLLNVSCEKLGVQLVWKDKNISLNFGPLFCYSRSNKEAFKILKEYTKEANYGR
jgi:N-acetylglucosamine kinase-like BadF-type ATPase